MSDLLFGALAGDMASLNALFVMLLPFMIVWSLGVWLVDKIRRGNK